MNADGALRVIGLMSGTSFDGIDAGAVDLVWGDGALHLTPRGMITRPLPEPVRAELAAALPPAKVPLETVCRLDTLIGRAFAETAAAAVEELCDGQADLVASHGQTVYHWIEDGQARGTLQIGQPAWIAEATGLPVVADFRPRDITAGGQGAPLVSLVDVLWLRSRPGNPVALNLGGIANITTGVNSDEPVAFDTGPANALIDAVVTHLSGGAERYDIQGSRAAQGTVHPVLLERLLGDPYYRLPAPKTTGKELFHLAYVREALAAVGPVEPNDLVATVTELTARTVAAAVSDHGGTEVIASGGGTRNPTLMTRLGTALGEVSLITTDDLGLASEAKEAYAFAVLGFLTLHGIGGTVPSCTGASRSTVLGAITPGSQPLTLPAAGLGTTPTALHIG